MSVTWDVFHSGRLELLRGLTLTQLRSALADGSLIPEDLVRVSGTQTAWVCLGDLTEIRLAHGMAEASDASQIARASAPPANALSSPPEGPRPLSSTSEGAPERVHPPALEDLFDESLGDQTPGESRRKPTEATPREQAENEITDAESVRDGVTEHDHFEAPSFDDQEPEADFLLAHGITSPLEDIDLTAMVDVSFQLILFFLIAATSVFLKTLEIPRPRADSSQATAVVPQTLEELETDFIPVTIGSKGDFTIDHEPVEAAFPQIAAKLRQTRHESGRTTMLLIGEPEALHQFAVLAYDAANEIGLRIAIATVPRP